MSRWVMLGREEAKLFCIPEDNGVRMCAACRWGKGAVRHCQRGERQGHVPGYTAPVLGILERSSMFPSAKDLPWAGLGPFPCF